MITLFSIDAGKVAHTEAGLEPSAASLEEANWIDVVNPDAAQKALLQGFLRTALPGSGDLEEIEPSSRCYVDAAGLHLHSLFLIDDGDRKGTHSVVCILQRNRLLTMRSCEVDDFTSLHVRARLGLLESKSAAELLLVVLETKVDTLADSLEEIHRKLEGTTKLVLENRDPALASAIDQLAKAEDCNGKILLSLMDTKRDVAFLLKHFRDQPLLAEVCGEIMHDIDTLMVHNSFLFNKINFLMESTQGFISIQQNQIIKTLSIATVVLLPPTLVASIYGMNFINMPELQWKFGYAWALLLMVFSGVLSLWFFKRKDWF